MAKPNGSRPDLRAVAVRALLEQGFEADFSPEVMAEVAAQPKLAPEMTHIRDLRGLPWSSIDNEESRDLDQVEVCEALAGDVIRVRVGVADVDARMAPDGPTHARAAQNTTSVYTGVAVFAMLPERLSTDLTSLNAGEDRLAMVVEMDVAPDGTLPRSDVYRAQIHNHAKLDYDSLSPWLEDKGPLPSEARAHPELEAQLRLQDAAARRLRVRRREQGALELESREARPVKRGGEIDDLAVPSHGRANDLIEDLMIAANGVIARYLQQKTRSGIARVVQTPKRWPRIVEIASTLGHPLPATPDPIALAAFLKAERTLRPEAYADLSLAVVKLLGRGEYVLQAAGQPPSLHFGLAMQGYSHSTAPNRRFADLVTQRLLKAALDGGPAPYSDNALGTFAVRCNEMERRAGKVERLMRKVIAAHILRTRIGEVFSGVITGASSKGTFVRLSSPPAEGRVVQGEVGLDVGDHVQVRLLSVDAERGFIDFART